MNINSIIERVQKVGDLLEKLIQQSNELRDRVIRLEENAEETSDSVAVLDAKVDRQTALLEALAEDADIDPETVYAEADLDGPIASVAGIDDSDEDAETDTTVEMDADVAADPLTDDDPETATSDDQSTDTDDDAVS